MLTRDSGLAVDETLSLEINGSRQRIRLCAARTGLPPAAVEPRLCEARERGLVETTGSGWRTTELGRRFLNDLQASFLA